MKLSYALGTKFHILFCPEFSVLVCQMIYL